MKYLSDKRQHNYSGAKLINMAGAVTLLVFTCMLGFNVYALEMVDRIVAIVNDELITYSALNESFKPYEKRIRERNYSLEKEMEVRFKVRENLINQLIDQKITDQQIAKAGIAVSDGEVNNAIERLKSMNSFTDEDLRKMLASEGVTMERYRKELKEQLLRTKLIQYEIKSKIVITQEEVGEYFKEHQEEFKDRTLLEVKPYIEDKLYQLQVEKKFKEWIKELRETAHIKIIQ